jgi:hypothetical protein
MRFLLIKILIFYIEYTILFSKIKIALFLFFTSIDYLKYVLHSYQNNNSIFIDYVELEYAGGNIESNASNEVSVLPVQLDEYFIAKEQWHIAKDHLGKWHIGLAIEIVDWDDSIVLCVDVLVSVSLFFRFPLQKAKQYLIEMAEDNQDVIILAAALQYNIVGVEFQMGDMYDLPDLPVIIKTYWIRIIQRAWKRVYSERMCLLKLRGGIKAQRQFELTGKYGIQSGCGLRGLLVENRHN